MVEPGTLGPILRFYAAYSDLTAMVDDARSEDFAKLAADRRMRAHQRLTQNRKATLFWGLTAIYAINRAMGVRGPGNIPRSGQNPDVQLS